MKHDNDMFIFSKKYCFQIDEMHKLMHSFLATIQVLKSGASGVPFLKIQRMFFFWSSRQGVWLKK